MSLPIKILVIAVVTKDESILMRKKPDGSEPYKETWYLFGAELDSRMDPEASINELLKLQARVQVRFVKDLGWDTEIKVDHDGIEKQFVYLDAEFEYVDGSPTPSEGIEKIEWAKVSDLNRYDLVPPSRKLFKKLGYI